MKVDELRGKDDADLEVILGKSRRDLFDLRFKSVTGEVEDTSALRETKRTIARILTVLKERTLGVRDQHQMLEE